MLAGGVNITTENITTEQHEDYPTELSQELEFKYASNEPDDVNEHKNKKNPFSRIFLTTRSRYCTSHSSLGKRFTRYNDGL